MSNCSARFKAGDKVRIKSSRLNTYWYADKIGEVVTISDYDIHYDIYRSAEYGTRCYIGDQDIESVQEESKVATPAADKWKDGLPQVGTEFEYSFDGEQWWKAVTTYVVSNHGVVAKCYLDNEVEQYLDESEVKFRPVKSKKEQAVEEMMRVADPTGCVPESTMLQCERLYDAGWRKA